MSFVTWIVIAAILLVAFAFALLVGIMRKSINTVILSVVLLLLSMCCGGVAVYKFFKEAYHEYKKETGSPKTNEI
jgi:uncharacterized membrane-anchored protein